MDDALFRKLDEEERIYAPEELPEGQQASVLADGGATDSAAEDAPGQTEGGSSGNVLIDLTTDNSILDDADEAESDDNRVLPPLPIRAGTSMGQL